MGYKVLGFIVWKGAKIYLGRRLGPHAGVKAAAASSIAAVGMTALVLGVRHLTSDGHLTSDD